MRSRFCAYALKLPKYIMKTTHNENKDYSLNKEQWEQDIQEFCTHTRFVRLDILEEKEGLEISFVTFKATLIQDNKDVSFIEKSSFIKEDNKWLYKDGIFLDEEEE